MILETERLILRPIDINDANDIYSFCKDEAIGRNAGWKPHENIEETKIVVSEIFLNKENVFGIILKENQKLIGTAGLISDQTRNNSDAKMLGYSLNKNYWGNGYMTEAAKAIMHYGFELLGSDIITATCFVHNSRSKAVLKRCGFTYEGTLRQAWALYDGTVMDCEHYSITADEYEEKEDN